MSSPRLTIKPATPTEKIIEHEKSSLENEVIDADGKVYKLRLPDPVDEFDLSAALGRDNSTNIGLLLQAMPLLYIESIDGVPFSKPGNYNEIRAALKRVGRNGMKVVNAAFQKFNLSEQTDREETINDIKK